jgi:hypothetical protein
MTREELLKGCSAYHAHELRDSVYVVARHWIEQFWDSTDDIVDGLIVLLLSWNANFYRFSPANFSLLPQAIEKSRPLLERLRKKTIIDFLPDNDQEQITEMFDFFMVGTRTQKGHSPVGAAKALHLLVPDSFPIWDERIAKHYSCYWYHAGSASEKYLKFMAIAKSDLDRLLNSLSPSGDSREAGFELFCRPCPVASKWRSPLKIIDEYNYAKYTKGWI